MNQAVPRKTFFQLCSALAAGPNGNISSSTFGQIRSARDPRILQASMKLIF
ncbi:MAG TPA: hypothetical protein VKE70_21850 [Candidatus Solibacter sp.]|nr:hypothetical protein [Candidatus Solibacter sp.]